MAYSFKLGPMPKVNPQDEEDPVALELADIYDAKKQLAVAGGQEVDRSGDMPTSTVVNYGTAEPDVASPPSRMPLKPRLDTPQQPAEKVVQVPNAGVDDLEMAYAKQLDREQRAKNSFERGTRQLIAGLTRTQAVDSEDRPQTAVHDLLAKRSRADDLRLKDNAQGLEDSRTKAYLETSRAQEAKALREEEARRLERESNGKRLSAADERDTERLRLEREKFDESKRHALVDESIKLKVASRPHGGGAKHTMTLDENGELVPSTVAEARFKLQQDKLKARGDWEPIDSKALVFRDTADADKFDAADAAYGALQNHRAHAKEALKKFHEAKSLAEKDAALAVVNQQMANIASKLRVAEGLNSSDASNAAVDTMLSLSNGSVASLRNFANEGRLDAILDSALSSAGTNLDTLAHSRNLRRKKAGGGQASSERKTATGPNGEKYQLSADGKSWELVK